MIFILLLLLCLSLQCSVDIAGGTSTTDNPRVIGYIRGEDNQPATNTKVLLIPHDFNPILAETLSDLLIDTTDNEGKYEFLVSKLGTYNIQAVHLYNKTSLLGLGIVVDSLTDSLLVPDDTLETNGTVKIFLPDSVDAVNGYIYLQGTLEYIFLNGNNNFVILDSVPLGLINSINYATKDSSTKTVIRESVTVKLNDTLVVTMPKWQHSKQLFLNTSATGAQVNGTVFNFPVLVRLSESNFDFSQTNPDGSDIRFTRNDNTLLFYEIESWDIVTRLAAIWVKVDTVYGNNNTQCIQMAWGNPDAINVSNSASVFDTANGFQGVWHLGEEGNTTSNDATGNHYNGTPNNMTAASAVQGTIDGAQEFDGVSSSIIMENTAGSKLNFPEKGTYTLSAWVHADTIDNNHTIVGKGLYQYYLKLSSSVWWEFVEYRDRAGWWGSKYDATIKTWKHLVGTRTGDLQMLYLDGVLVDSGYIVNNDDTLPRDMSNDISIGRFIKFEPHGNGYAFFNGKIDEVRISSALRSSNWIRLCYMNQREDDKLVRFK